MRRGGDDDEDDGAIDLKGMSASEVESGAEYERRSISLGDEIRLKLDGETADFDDMLEVTFGVYSLNGHGNPQCGGENLTSGTEYTYENGVLTLHDAGKLAGGHCVAYLIAMKGEEEAPENITIYAAEFVIDCDTFLQLKKAPEGEDNITSPYACAALNEAVTLTLPNGTHPGNVAGTDQIELRGDISAGDGQEYELLSSDSWSYDASTGKLTITNAQGYDMIDILVLSQEHSSTYMADYSGVVMIKSN